MATKGTVSGVIANMVKLVPYDVQLPLLLTLLQYR